MSRPAIRHDDDHANRVPTEQDWAKLTVVPEKRSLFAEESYFRECWDDLDHQLATDAASFLAPLAQLSFKPDAVVGRRLRPTLAYLAEHGFTPLGGFASLHNRHSMRELWRYNWHIYTTDRLQLCNLIYQSTPTLSLFLRDERNDDRLPGAARLSSLRGSSYEEQREPHQLRTLLEPPNKILNFVHVADEPADIVRELGIFFDRDARRRIFRDLARNDPDAARQQIEAQVAKLESDYPQHDLDSAASLERLAASGRVDAKGATRLRHAIDDQQIVRWDELQALVGGHRDASAAWDLICVACELLPAERGELPSPIPHPSYPL